MPRTPSPSKKKPTTTKPSADLFATILPERPVLDTLVHSWLSEDLPSFDVGGFVVGSEPRSAVLWMKSPGVLAGKPFVESVFRILGCTIEWKQSVAHEGVLLNQPPPGTKGGSSSGPSKLALAVVTGPANRILQGERTALNTLSRCSGIATDAQLSVQQARNVYQWTGYLAGTRKTTPGFRLAEKYALLVGGIATHRLDLSQMVMLKDNHIQSTGSITAAVQLAKQAAGFSAKIEVECSSLEDAIEAAKAGADIVMLDNFEPEDLKEDAAKIKKKFPHVLIEASGGITASTMASYFSPNIDIVSQGRFTQGYGSVDFSLKIVTDEQAAEAMSTERLFL